MQKSNDENDDFETNKNMESEWFDEAKARIEAYNKGYERAIPLETVLAEIKAKYQV